MYTLVNQYSTQLLKCIVFRYNAGKHVEDESSMKKNLVFTDLKAERT